MTFIYLRFAVDNNNPQLAFAVKQCMGTEHITEKMAPNVGLLLAQYYLFQLLVSANDNIRLGSADF